MLEQIYGWIGNLGFILGAILFAKKNKLGFIMQIIANLFYVLQSILMNNFSLLLLSVILILINIYGYFKWNQKRNKLCIK